jgi:hypothetical protein
MSVRWAILTETSDLIRYVRKMRLAGGAPPVLLAVAPGPGMLVVHSWADLGLHVFNVNGRHLVSADGNERLAALAISPDGHFLLTGGQRGIASLHWLHSLEVRVRALSPCLDHSYLPILSMVHLSTAVISCWASLYKIQGEHRRQVVEGPWKASKKAMQR